MAAANYGDLKLAGKLNAQKACIAEQAALIATLRQSLDTTLTTLGARIDRLEVEQADLIDNEHDEDHDHVGAFAAARHGNSAHTEAYLTSLPGQIPSGAVLAFDLPGGCPDGWSPFAEAQSRTLVGASFGLPTNLFRQDQLTQYKYRDHDGAETVTLTETEMPKHQHWLELVTEDEGSHHHAVELGTRYAGGSDGFGGGGRNRINTDPAGTHSHVVKGTTQHKGESQPHNNMPPYIALYFCKKE